MDYIIGNATIQNGSDAVGVYAGNATDFPNGSALSSLNRIDGLVYTTGDPEVNGLITGLGLDVMFPGYTQFDATAQQNGFDLTISGVPDGGVAFDLSGFVLQPLTPGNFNIVASGCINQQACNFDPMAMMDDDTCILPDDPCDDGYAETVADTNDTNCEYLGLAPLDGCNDEFACNFNPLATTNDGSCLYVTDPCDDGNPLTVADVYDSACNCTGVIGVEENTALNGINIYPNSLQESLFV